MTLAATLHLKKPGNASRRMIISFGLIVAVGILAQYILFELTQ